MAVGADPRLQPTRVAIEDPAEIELHGEESIGHGDSGESDRGPNLGRCVARRVVEFEVEVVEAAGWDRALVEFVKKVSEISRGKAYFTNTMTLGQFILMDFLRKKTRKVS